MFNSNDTFKRNCPYCGTECEANLENNELVLSISSPYVCHSCGATQIDLTSEYGFDMELYYEHAMKHNIPTWDENIEQFVVVQAEKFVLPEEATVSQEEWDKGWLNPNKDLVSKIAKCQKRLKRKRSMINSILYKSGLYNITNLLSSK